MPQFADFYLDEQISQNSKIAIWRGHAPSKDLTIIIKLLKDKHPSPRDFACLKHEYDLLKKLNLPCVVQPIEFIRDGQSCGITFEDDQAESLSRVLQNKPMTLSDFLPIAIELAKAVGKLHENGIIHKDIKPDNIVINVKTNQLKLIDFSIACEIATEYQDRDEQPELLEGTLSYMSPEQTGRVNQIIDYRSDYYSLGVTFYQMLTGQLPFKSENSMEIIHHHIATTPKSVHELVNIVPVSLSNIVMKLMAKNSDERYQSSQALIYDLTHCLNELRTKNKIEDFEIAQHDIPSKFVISQKSYGRENEIKMLLNVFQEVSQGQTKLVLVKGYSGTGKTSLINNIQVPVTQHNGFFIRGKFEQYKQDSAFYPIATAFEHFAQQILHLSEQELEKWRQRISHAVGKNGKIITDLSPSWSKILGEQSPLEELAPQQALNRFYFTIHEFIRASATKEHPLVMFIDDLQWTDSSTLNLLLDVISSALTHYVLIIGAYRSNEVDSQHILQQAIEAIEKKNPIFHLVLMPLKLSSVVNLIADTLYASPKRVRKVAEYIYQKTLGNPFYIKMLLMRLYQDKFIYFDYSKGLWEWNYEAIKLEKISENVVQFLLLQLHELPEETQYVIQRAACIGNHFGLKILSTINKHNQPQTAEMLQPAIDKGLIIPLNKEYKFATYLDKNVEANFDVLYEFTHDRVQQAAYHLLKKKQRKIIHLDIARLLCVNSKEEVEKNIIEITHHFNVAGSNLIKDTQEKIKIAEFNLLASIKVKSSGCYPLALHYAKIAKLLLPENAFADETYHLTFNIYKECAIAAYLIGEYQFAEDQCSILIKEAKTDFEKSTVLYMQLVQYTVTSSFEKALNIGLKGISFLNFKLDENPNIFQVIYSLIVLKRKISKIDILSLNKRPICTDPALDLTIKYLIYLSNAAYGLKRENFLAVLVSKAIQLGIDKPLTNKSAVTLAAGVYFFSGIFHNYKYAAQFNQIIMEQVENYPDHEVLLTTNLALAVFWWPLVENKIFIYKALKKSLEAARESGNKHYVPEIYSLLFAFKPDATAADICKLTIKHWAEIKELNIINTPYLFLIQYSYYFNLCNETPTADSLSYSLFNEEEFHSTYHNTTYYLIPYYYNLVKLRLAYHYEDYAKGLSHIEQAFFYQGNDVSVYNIKNLYMFSFLIYAESLKNQSWLTRLKFKIKMNKSYQKIKNWADNFPNNFNHLFLLMKAEYERLNKNHSKAIEYYNSSIKHAKRINDYEWLAIIKEQLIKCYLEIGLIDQANIELFYLLQYYRFQGAKRKRLFLENRYTDIIKNIDYEEYKQKTSTDSSTGTSNKDLDLTTMLKASNAISSELELSKLLSKLLHIVMENAGAERGILLLKSDEAWNIEAQGSLQKIEVLQHIPLEKSQDYNLPVCNAIINLVIRQGTLLVLADAAHNSEYGQDPYISKNQIQSVLCIPLINMGILRGILYLENNLMPGAFTSKQQFILSSLSSQAAVAIDNAELYNNVINLNRSYERFIPKEFFKLLSKDSVLDIDLGDHMQKNMTIMFADIRNFTSLSEKLTPQQNFDFINQFLSYMEPAIHEHHGFIDKYIGDAIMALFSNADDAVQCSMAMLKQLELFNQKQTMSDEPLRIGIGLNFGPLTLGIVGGKIRMETTVISDSVNIASRVQELNKKFMTNCLATGSIIENISPIHQLYVRRLAWTQIRGKTEPLPIYEVFDNDSIELKQYKINTKDKFEQAIQLFDQKKFNEAKNIFLQLHKECRDDKICKIYLHLCRQNSKKTS